MDDQEFFC